MVLKVSIISINDFIFCQIKGHWPATILKIYCQEHKTLQNRILLKQFTATASEPTLKYHPRQHLTHQTHDTSARATLLETFFFHNIKEMVVAIK